MRKATTAKISSHVCSARNPMACPAPLKRKETIEPSSPRRSIAVFFAELFQSVSQSFACCFQSLGNRSDDRADRNTSSKKDRCQRHSMFFEDFFDPLTRWKRSFSFLKRTISSFLSATLPSAASLSEREVFSSLMIA